VPVAYRQRVSYMLHRFFVIAADESDRQSERRNLLQCACGINADFVDDIKPCDQVAVNAQKNAVCDFVTGR